MNLANVRTKYTAIRLFLVVAFFSFPGSIHCASQPTFPPAVFDLDKDRQALVSLDGPWRFHAGDDPTWARPDFDDSTWQLYYPSKPWSEQRFSGTAWFRAKIRVPANYGSVSIYRYYIDDSFQLFVDGKLLSSEGGLPPAPKAYGVVPSIILLPSHSPENQSYTLTVAIRVWLWPNYAEFHRGGISPGTMIGSPALVAKAFEAQNTKWSWKLVSHILIAFLGGLAALTALALFAFRRKEREYFWFSLYLFATTSTLCSSIYYQFHTLSVAGFGAVFGFLSAIAAFAEILFYFRLLGSKRNFPFWATLAFAFALLCVSPLAALEIIGNATVSILVVAFDLPITIWILVLLSRRAIQGFPDARLLLAPVFFAKIVGLINIDYWLAFSLNLYQGSSDWIDHAFSWPFDISLPDIGDGVFLVGMLAVLIHRFTRTRLHEENYEREREAARTVQQVLIPEEIPPVPGFSIQSIYRPFGEVGGDFFQILPITTGGALIVIGDVSGKGLPAAMTVSLLVGTLRTLSHYTTQPGEIMAAMNQRMIGRSSGGFTTCLVLRASLDGTITAANAGHIAPYRDGEEMEVSSGLPLGLASDVTYTETIFELSQGQQLTLVTDGVVEARHPSGELFGFDRTAALSQQSAEAIAQTAHYFGQDDDITVLTIRREASAINRCPEPS